MKPNTGRIKRRTLPASGEKATFHVKQPGAAGRGGAFCRLRAEISCQGGKALLLYLKGGQRSISKAAVGFKGNGLSQRQRSISKAAACFKGNGLLQRQWRVAFQAPSAANCRRRPSFKYLCNCQTSIRHSRVLAHRERQGCLNSPFRSRHAPWSHPCVVYKDWLPNKRSGSKPVLQWQSVLPHAGLPTVCLFVAEGTSVQSSGVPASARRRRFRKVPIHGSYEGKMAPIFYRERG